MKIKTLILVVLFSGLCISFTFAAWDKKPEFRWMQFYRYDTRHDNDQLYTNRLSAGFSYLDAQKKPLFKVMPFYEVRRNFEKDLWERQELGVEIGKDIFPWFYLGQGIQQVWLKEEYLQYSPKKRRDATESETRLVFSHNILDKKYLTIKGFILDEYTYDFRKGAGTRNEVAIGLSVPVGKYLETGLDWRHIDRLHDYDSDTFEVLATFIF